MRQTFSTSSLDANLPLRFEGKVQSVFSKVFNIRTEEDELISIVAAEKLNGPNRILIELPEDKDFVSFEIKEGMRIEGNEQEVRVDGGRLSISLEGAERWSPEVKREGSTPTSRIKDNLSSLKRSLLIERKGDRISPALRARIHKLIKSLEKKNLSKVSENIKRFIGFGEGLTPSGDDFLVGLVASLHFLNDPDLKSFLQRIKEIINSEKDRTTFLSGKFLKYACQGRFPETVLNLIEAFFSGDREEVEEAARKCLESGATSGKDTVLGVLCGLSLGVRLEKRLL